MIKLENKAEQPKFYTHRDVAKILNICERNARLLMKNEDFPSFKLGKKMLVNEQDFNEWLENLAGKKIKIGGKDDG